MPAKKLNDEQVMLLRRCRQNEDLSAVDLFDLFGEAWDVKQSAIQTAMMGRTYKHLPLPDYPPLSSRVFGSNNPKWNGGVASHPEYSTWNHIKQRTTNPKNQDWNDYGGRGVTMFSGWVNDSKAFLEWIDENLGPKPEGMSIDRIDNGDDDHSGPGYVPGNLRWADASTQARNQRPKKTETGLIGVRIDRGLYTARISYQGQSHHIGMFRTPEQAAIARDDVATILFGNTARLNFPNRVSGSGEAA